MARRISVRPRDEVRFRSKSSIEQEADATLSDYERRFAPVLAPPVPIDNMLELQHELVFEFMDMNAKFGLGDVHGALWIAEKKVGVDESLDPDLYPSREGRYHFTLAHELGHWRLHRHRFAVVPGQGALFDAEGARPTYICRTSDSTSRVEWQANYYASCVLMPRRFVRQAWSRLSPTGAPITLKSLEAVRHKVLSPIVAQRGGWQVGSNDDNDALLEWRIKPLASVFRVSAEAMRIRLEELGLLVRNDGLLGLPL